MARLRPQALRLLVFCTPNQIYSKTSKLIEIGNCLWSGEIPGLQLFEQTDISLTEMPERRINVRALFGK
jgi:hypothetical protein